MAKRIVSTECRFADTELTRTALPESQKPFDYDRWIATYITRIGPLDNDGVPAYLLVELWRGQSAKRGPKKLRTIKFSREC